MTDAVILVGGRGSRLGNQTLKIPKPLIKIQDKRFLDILLSKLIRYNFKKIYLLCSYKKKIFFKLYNNKIIHNSKIICIDEGSQKDTGGALFKIRNKIKKNFFLINGDSFLDINLNSLKKKLKDKIIGVIALASNKNYKKNKKMNYLDVDKNHIVKFRKSNFMNGGIYYFSKKIFSYTSNKKISLENDILYNLILTKKIKGIKCLNRFIDIGTLKNLNFLKKNSNYVKQKAAFLDRDGVINQLKKNDYIKNFKEFKFLPGVIKSLKYLSLKDYLIIIITNQACVGKSIISEKQLNYIHYKMRKKIYNTNQVLIDDIYYSPYFKDSKFRRFRLNYYDRKPNPGMFLKAINKWNISIKDSFFIGDSVSDFDVANKLNIKFFYNKKRSFLKQIKKITN